MKTVTYKNWEIQLLRSCVRCKNLKNNKTLKEWFPPSEPIYQWKKHGKLMIDTHLANELLTAKEKMVNVLYPFSKEARVRIVQKGIELLIAKEKVVNVLKPFNKEARKRIFQKVIEEFTSKEKVFNALKPLNKETRQRVVWRVIEDLKLSEQKICEGKQ